jgi:rhodanese-related sulfurtransferase
MPTEIERPDVQRLAADGAQLVEVLPASEYREDHLPGASNLPLRRLETEAGGLLHPERPVVVYCWDSASDLSPRAAWRLETLGFREVYDYVDGKLDWLAAGLPTEGANAQLPRAGDVARRDVPTCGLAERLRDVRDRVTAAGWDTCVVETDASVVMGLLRAGELEDRRDVAIEEAMRPGPSTFRPHVRSARWPDSCRSTISRAPP